MAVAVAVVTTIILPQLRQHFTRPPLHLSVNQSVNCLPSIHWLFIALLSVKMSPVEMVIDIPNDLHRSVNFDVNRTAAIECFSLEKMLNDTWLYIPACVTSPVLIANKNLVGKII